MISRKTYGGVPKIDGATAKVCQLQMDFGRTSKPQTTFRCNYLSGKEKAGEAYRVAAPRVRRPPKKPAAKPFSNNRR